MRDCVFVRSLRKPLKIGRLAAPLLLLLLACRPSVGQNLAGGNLPLQPLGPNDLVSVAVLGVPELSRSVRIAEDGSLRLPLLPQPIPAAGKLPQQLESDIAAALRQNELVVEPVVSVTVAEYVSRPVTVAGAVRNPTTMQSMPGMRLLEAISRAGGLSEDAGAEILLNNRSDANHPEHRILVKELMARQDEGSNPVLRGGDEIRIPRAPRIFIMGNVRKPGAILLVESSDSSVMKALALSEGLAPFASDEAYIMRPQPGSSQKQEIAVNLKTIMNRKSPDVALQADDIFFVPDNKTRRISSGVLDRLVSFGSATSSGLLIWRR